VASWRKSPWWAAGASVVPAGLMLYGVSVPGGNYDTLVAALWAWAIVGLAWVVFGAAWRADPPEPRWRLWPLAVVPLVFAASWWAASGELVGKATFTHYRAELERLADRAPGSGATDVGPYSFNSVSRSHGCVLYFLRGPAMARASGFAWCPGTTPASVSLGEGEIFEKIRGDWYVLLVRHGAFKDRLTGADPWGLQITELRSTPEA
jgi:hypothetical protein